MKNLLLYAAFALALASCSSTRVLERARKVLAAHQLSAPPAQQLSELIAQHPELQGQTVRTVKERDTVRIPGATVTVRIPAASTAATDNSLIDSLMRSASRQLHAKDSMAFTARLRAILAARPRLARDTLTQVLGPLTVRTWVDGKGVPHTTVASAPQKVAFEKTVTHTGPVVVQREMSVWQRTWLFVKDAAGFVIAIVVMAALVWLVFFVKRQRDKTANP